MLRCFSTTRHSIVQHAQRWPLALVRTNRKIHSKSAYHACCGVQSLRDRQGAAIRDASLRGFVDIISLRRTTSTTLRLRALGQKRGVRSCLRSISHTRIPTRIPISQPMSIRRQIHQRSHRLKLHVADSDIHTCEETRRRVFLLACAVFQVGST